MFQKFMGNKDFHPATYQNLKKVTIEGSAHKARVAEERSSCGRCVVALYSCMRHSR